MLSSQYSAYLAVKEDTYNTDAVDAAITANEDLVYQAVETAGALTPDERYEVPAQARPGEAAVKGSHIPTFGGINLPMFVRGGVGANFEPENAWAFECAGWRKITNAGTSTVFTLGHRCDESATIYKYQRNLLDNNWRLARALGVIGQLNFSLANPGAELMMTLEGNSTNYPEWTIERAYFDSDDEPALAYDGSSYSYTGAATAAAGTRIQCIGATATYDGVDMPLESAQFQQSMSVAVLESILQAESTGSRVSRQRPDDSAMVLNLAFNMSDDTPGAFFAEALAGYQADEVAAVQFRFANATHRFTLDFPAVQLRRPTERPNGESMAWNMIGIVTAPTSTPFGEGAAVATFDAAP